MDYCVRYVDLPYSIKGIAVPDVNGFFNIYINSRLSFEEQAKALRHEKTHIFRDDFDKINESIYTVEEM